MNTEEKPSALYEIIKGSITDHIQTGRLRPNDKIPSESELAKEFNVSRMTANRALKELAEEGWIVRLQGVGSFVGLPKPEAALLEIKSIAREIREWGGVHSCDILHLKEESVTEEIAFQMNLNAERTVFHSIIVHKNRGFPVQYSERFINPEVAPDYIHQDFKTMTPNEYLISVAPIEKAEHIIESAKAAPEICTVLQIEPGEPCLILTRRTWSKNRVAAYSILTSPGSKYKLKGRFTRG